MDVPKRLGQRDWAMHISLVDHSHSREIAWAIVVACPQNDTKVSLECLAINYARLRRVTDHLGQQGHEESL